MYIVNMIRHNVVHERSFQCRCSWVSGQPWTLRFANRAFRKGVSSVSAFHDDLYFNLRQESVLFFSNLTSCALAFYWLREKEKVVRRRLFIAAVAQVITGTWNITINRGKMCSGRYIFVIVSKLFCSVRGIKQLRIDFLVLITFFFFLLCFILQCA